MGARKMTRRERPLCVWGGGPDAVSGRCGARSGVASGAEGRGHRRKSLPAPRPIPHFTPPPPQLPLRAPPSPHLPNTLRGPPPPASSDLQVPVNKVPQPPPAPPRRAPPQVTPGCEPAPAWSPQTQLLGSPFCFARDRPSGWGPLAPHPRPLPRGSGRTLLCTRSPRRSAGDPKPGSGAPHPQPGPPPAPQHGHAFPIALEDRPLAPHPESLRAGESCPLPFSLP